MKKEPYAKNCAKKLLLQCEPGNYRTIQLANMAYVSRDTILRALRELSEEGKLSYEGVKLGRDSKIVIKE